MVKQQYNVKFPPELLKRARKRSEESGITLTELIEDSLRTFVEWDFWFYGMLNDLSQKMQIPASVILSQCLVRALAQAHASRRILKYTSGPLGEIITTDIGPYPSQDLYESELGNRIRDYEHQKEEELLKEKSYGIPLDPEDETWLDARQLKRDPWDSEEYLKTVSDPIKRKGLRQAHAHQVYCMEIEKAKGKEAALAYHMQYIAISREQGLDKAIEFEAEREQDEMLGLEGDQRPEDKQK